jgi:transcriptional regulator with XRE-family HTH domain
MEHARKIYPASRMSSEENQAEPLGSRLRRLRIERGLSQRDLSSPGVSYAYISRIEAGARTPSVKALRMLASKLGVSVEYLETGRDIRDTDERELRLADAELELRLGGDTAAAQREFASILDDARRAGDRVAAGRAALGLGFAAATKANHLDAVEHIEAALQEHPVPPYVEPDIYALLGRSYTALGAPDRAVRVFERCLSEIDDAVPEDTGARVRFAALLSDALERAGEFDRARTVTHDALGRLERDADPRKRVRTYRSIARSSARAGHQSQALHYTRKAIALLETTEDAIQLARGCLLAAENEALDGLASETAEHLALAERLLPADPERRDLAVLHVCKSRLAALEGDGAGAVANARRAQEILGERDGAERGAAVWALAEGLALLGDGDEADEAFRRAVDLLIVHGRRHDAAHACEHWAQMLQTAGRRDEAAAVSRRAADLGAPAQSASRSDA